VEESLVAISKQQMLSRVCGEYMEMPGLRLTREQASRLWGIDAQTCSELLEDLIDSGFLCRTSDGRYARLTEGTVAFLPFRMPRGERIESSAGEPTGATQPRNTSRRW
jgi:hypothetical protein